MTPRPLLALALVLVLALVTSCIMPGGPRPGEDECRESCLRYSRLRFDEIWAEKLAPVMATQERAELEKQRDAEWKDIVENPDRGLGGCIASCNRPGRSKQVECIAEAETFAEARACEPEGTGCGCRVGGR